MPVILIDIDILMPDGLTLLRRLRANPRLAHRRIRQISATEIRLARDMVIRQGRWFR